MANVTISLKNQSRVVSAFRKSSGNMGRELQNAILQTGVFTAGEVKKVITSGDRMWKSPIRTGMMRRGVQMRQTGRLKAIVTPSDLTPYAAFVHEGTRYMRARPFFQITAESKQHVISRFFGDILDKAAKNIIRI